MVTETHDFHRLNAVLCAREKHGETLKSKTTYLGAGGSNPSRCTIAPDNLAVGRGTGNLACLPPAIRGDASLWRSGRGVGVKIACRALADPGPSFRTRNRDGFA
jgi:hypothetical protein